MRTSLWLPTLLLFATAPALASDDHDDDRDDDDRPRVTRRAAHDVAVSLGRLKPTPAGTRVRVRLKNRGRSFESGVHVALWSDAQTTAPVWEATSDVRRGGHRTWKLVLALPEGTTLLTASCDFTAGTDGDPTNDDDAEPVPGGGGGVVADPLAVEGAKIWLPLCSGCHGADGTGGTIREDISREDAEDIAEAVREGEESMPVFPEIGWADAQAIAAFLRNPDVTIPTDPPPDGGGTGGGGTGGGGGTTTAPTWTSQVSAIFSRSCAACHTGAAAAAKTRLDTYATASANAAKAVNAIAAGRMPPGGGQFPAADLQILRDWVAAGTPK